MVFWKHLSFWAGRVVLKLVKEGELSDNDFAGLKWAKNLRAFSTELWKKLSCVFCHSYLKVRLFSKEFLSVVPWWSFWCSRFWWTELLQKIVFLKKFNRSTVFCSDSYRNSGCAKVSKEKWCFGKWFCWLEMGEESFCVFCHSYLKVRLFSKEFLSVVPW